MAAQLQSADINACINNPCAANAVCADLPAPAVDEQAGRSCTCEGGYGNYVEGVGCEGVPENSHNSVWWDRNCLPTPPAQYYSGGCGSIPVAIVGHATGGIAASISAGQKSLPYAIPARWDLMNLGQGPWWVNLASIQCCNGGLAIIVKNPPCSALPCPPSWAVNTPGIARTQSCSHKDSMGDTHRCSFCFCWICIGLRTHQDSGMDSPRLTSIPDA